LTALNSKSTSTMISPHRAANRSFCIRWRSLQARARQGKRRLMESREFVIRVELISPDKCVFEALIQNDAGGETTVMPSSICAARCSEQEGMLHVDVFGGGQHDERFLALSIECDEDGGADHLWYAATPLLAGSGFEAGMCDRAALVDVNETERGRVVAVQADALRRFSAIGSK
jgi:hypothetical protein